MNASLNPSFFKTGIPVSGIMAGRRSSVNTQKPPPPVRRTASVSGTAPTHVQKLRSPPRQLTEGPPPQQGNEGPYAELALIQQNIHQQQQMGHYQHYQQQLPHPQQQQQQQPHSIMGPPPAHALQRTASYPTTSSMTNIYHDPNHPGHHHPPQAAASVIQSLNAQFASLNSQYQDGVAVGLDANPNAARPPPPAGGQMRALPPATIKKQKVNNQNQNPVETGNVSQDFNQYAPTSHMITGPGVSQPGFNNGQPNNTANRYPPQQGQGPQYPLPPHLMQQQQHLQQQQQHHEHPPQSHYSMPVHNNHQHQQQNQHHQQYYQQQQHYQHQQQQHYQVVPPPPLPPPIGDEDFPLPPTVEELQEIERVYSRPPAINNAPPPSGPASGPKSGPQTAQKPSQGKRPSISNPNANPNPQVTQQSLMMELKRRVSVDDSSEA